MKAKSLFFSLCIAGLCSASFVPEAHAIPRPQIPTGRAAGEANLLTDHQRRALRKELTQLSNELRWARSQTGKTPELEPLRQAVQEARASKNPEALKAAQKRFSDERESLLWKQNGIPEKLQRLQELGVLLEYDTTPRKEQRAAKAAASAAAAVGAQPAASAPAAIPAN